jgi:hypothetical protein
MNTSHSRTRTHTRAVLGSLFKFFSYNQRLFAFVLSLSHRKISSSNPLPKSSFRGNPNPVHARCGLFFSEVNSLAARAILLVLILSTIILVQGKRPLRPPFKESYSEYLSVTYDATSESSIYTPSGPVVVTVWVFPDVNYDGAEIFQIKILYNGLWVIARARGTGYTRARGFPTL